MRLRSSKPADPPRLEMELLRDATDIELLIEGIGMLRDVFGSGPLGKHVVREHQPGVQIRTRADLEQYVRRAVYLLYHGVGSNRMGSDERSVVDPQLRVHGVAGLRVADASVMPAIPCSNTNSTVLAIAEKAAEHVLDGA